MCFVSVYVCICLYCALSTQCGWKRRIYFLHRSTHSVFFSLLFNNKTKKANKKKSSKIESHFISYRTHTVRERGERKRVKHGIRAAVVISSHVYNTLSSTAYILSIQRLLYVVFMVPKPSDVIKRSLVFSAYFGLFVIALFNHCDILFETNSSNTVSSLLLEN